MARYGATLKRHLLEGYNQLREGVRDEQGNPVDKGSVAMKRLLDNMRLTEQEWRNPEKYRDTIAKKYANVQDLDPIDLFENFFGSPRSVLLEESDAAAWMQMRHVAEQKKLLSLPLTEAEILSTSFDLLTKAKLYTTMVAIYTTTPAVWDRFASVFNNPFPTYDHQIPSEAPEVLVTGEAEEYKTAQISDRWAQTRAWKLGRMLEVTRETMLTDQFGKVVETCKGIAENAKYAEDDLVAKALQDQTNVGLHGMKPQDGDAGCYWPERANVALYRTTAGTTKPRYEYTINQVTGNALKDWKSLEKPIQLMMAMKNANGQYIDTIGAKLTLLVPYGLLQRASQMLASVMAVTGPVTAGAGSAGTSTGTGIEVVQMRAGNPMQHLGIGALDLVMWKKLDNDGSAPTTDSTWYLVGDSQKQLRMHRRWGVEFSEATPAQMGGDDFRKDVIYKIRAGFNAGPRCVDDKYIVQCTK